MPPVPVPSVSADVPPDEADSVPVDPLLPIEVEPCPVPVTSQESVTGQHADSGMHVKSHGFIPAAHPPGGVVVLVEAVDDPPELLAPEVVAAVPSSPHPANPNPNPNPSANPKVIKRMLPA